MWPGLVCSLGKKRGYMGVQLQLQGRVKFSAYRVQWPPDTGCVIAVWAFHPWSCWICSHTCLQLHMFSFSWDTPEESVVGFPGNSIILPCGLWDYMLSLKPSVIRQRAPPREAGRQGKSSWGDFPWAQASTPPSDPPPFWEQSEQGRLPSGQEQGILHSMATWGSCRLDWKDSSSTGKRLSSTACRGGGQLPLSYSHRWLLPPHICLNYHPLFSSYYERWPFLTWLLWETELPGVTLGGMTQGYQGEFG